MTSALARGLTDGSLRQMDAVGTATRRQFAIGSNQDEQPTASTDGRYRECERLAALRIARAHHDHTAARQGARGGKRIGQPLVIGHQHQRRGFKAALCGKLCRRSCQSAPPQAIAHLMALSNDAIAENLRLVLARIDAARKDAINPAPFTRLIAVSKMHNADEARVLLAAGHRVFGESRVQESLAKWTQLKRDFPDVELHLIGPLQTNKVPEAVALFDVIHSLDRPKLARALKSECDKTGRRPALFVQVNTGEEPQKAGVPPQEAAGFIASLRELKLNLTGLMCIPPVDDAPAPHFALLAKLAAENGLPYLSMGMSDDFEIAIRLGATHVRVGTAIFGERA